MEKEYTFILPCLNEEKTLEYCKKEIQKTKELIVIFRLTLFYILIVGIISFYTWQ